jgi:hypothetical protein
MADTGALSDALTTWDGQGSIGADCCPPTDKSGWQIRAPFRTPLRRGLLEVPPATSSAHGHLPQTVTARHVLAAKEERNAGGRAISLGMTTPWGDCTPGVVRSILDCNGRHAVTGKRRVRGLPRPDWMCGDYQGRRKRRPYRSSANGWARESSGAELSAHV